MSNTYKLYALQIKSFYCGGSDFVGDVPLTKKILAALTTGKHGCGCFSIYLSFLLVLWNKSSLVRCICITVCSILVVSYYSLAGSP